MRDPDLERLLRAAAKAEELPAAAPFGFETRVVAQWRATAVTADGGSGELARMLQRVIIGAAAVTLLASASTYWQWNADAAVPFGNAYAIADSAIDAELYQ